MARALAPALVAVAAAAALSSCGSGGTARSPAALHLQREDFASVAHALTRARPSAANEVAAAKRAWPVVVHGLPSDGGAASQASILAAGAAAAKIVDPPLFSESNADTLTGSGARLAGMFRNYSGLASRGWRLIAAAGASSAHGSPANARFARANSPLYIESVYDAHFILSQIGKAVSEGYEKLGGANGFGATLSPQEVDALTRAYSEANDRLYPRATVKVGT